MENEVVERESKATVATKKNETTTSLASLRPSANLLGFSLIEMAGIRG